MTAMPHAPLTQAEVLLEGFLALDTPEGFRAELIEGEIVVTPPPDGDHEKYISRVLRQVIRNSLVDMDVSGNKGLKVAGSPERPRNHVIPDLTFAPVGADLFAGADSWMPGDGVAMVLEVTSSRPSADRESKRRCYARGGIPLYLLVDRDTSTVTLFTDPESGDYRELHAVPFGKPLPLPAPFGFDLETADFL
ncbi:Uma2 family endonuclease [Streptomyces sp. NBC_01077]|uniref:Uma2 family endonuclease n=1 Tax=Streptomyces sp. NBC_01077 TaxID=2903746 RepID=UPI00386FA2C7|nr:Uma2 family endonuclease [Streptomyces sp. NBC_01077]